MSRPPLGDWQHEQERLKAETIAIRANNETRAYEAGRKRGEAGQEEPPPWMGHVHELFPRADPVQLAQFQHAHRYGQVEGFVDTEPDRLEAEYRPQAEKIATQAKAAQERLDTARLSYGARGMVALAGRSRYPITPTARRSHLAAARLGAVNEQANQLHAELTARLGHVDELRDQLDTMPWQPPSRR